MRVTVSDVADSAGRCRVAFSCPLGQAWGYWQGDPPDGGSSYDVELDLSADEVVSLTAAPRLETGPSISAKADGTVVVRAVVVSSEDGCTALQLGDNVLLVDVDSPDTPVGSPIALEMRSIGLFPFSL